MKVWMILGVMLLTETALAQTAVPQSPASVPPPPPPPGPIAAADATAWQADLETARQQFGVLELFARITQLQMLRVSVPQPMQRVPLEQVQGMESLAQQVKIYIKQLAFDKVRIIRQDRTLWSKDHPVLPFRMDFDTIRVKAEANTPVGVIPLEGYFTKGKIPSDLDVFRDRIEVRPTPAYRKEEGQLEKVEITSPTPLVGPILTALAARDLGTAILSAGVGTTLTLQRDQLLGGNETGLLNQVLPLVQSGEEASKGNVDGASSLLDKLFK